jgi:hypothetical protein
MSASGDRVILIRTFTFGGSVNNIEQKQALEEILNSLYSKLAIAEKNGQDLEIQLSGVNRDINDVALAIEATSTVLALLEKEILRSQTAEPSVEEVTVQSDPVLVPVPREIKGISPQSMAILGRAFESNLPATIEECLDRSGSDWRMRKVLVSSGYTNGNAQPSHITYEEDLLRGDDSRIRIQLVKDWQTIMDPRNNSLGLPCQRLVRKINEHPSTAEERQAMFAMWGLNLNT